MLWCMNVKYYWNASLSGKINPWQMMGSFGKLNLGALLRMKSMCIFKLCLECFRWGFLLFLFEEKLCWGTLILLEKILWGVFTSTWGIKFRNFRLSLTLLENYTWLGRMEVSYYLVGSKLHNNLLGIIKSIIIWSNPRIYSNSLGIMANSNWGRGVFLVIWRS